MGSSWHKKAERSGREWVIYAVAGVVLLLVAGGITVGVVVGGKSSSSSDDEQPQSTGSVQPLLLPLAPAPSVVREASTVELSPPPSPSLAASPPPPMPTAAPTTSAPAPAPAAQVQPPPTPLAVGSPPPVASTPPPALSPPPQPPPPVPTPLPVAAPTQPASPKPSGYDPTFVAPGTINGAPPGPGFVQDVAPGKKGTCDMQDSFLWYCNDDMTGASGPDINSLALMHDAEMMETCGFADMTTVVNSLVQWAYKGQCGIAAYTVARACIGLPGIADGYWRARVQLWPSAESTGADCVPLCIKLRGFQNTVTEYGRTGACNRPRD